MRSSSNLRLAVLLFLGALAVATALRAQEPPKATAPAPAPASEPATETAAEAEGTAPAGEKAAPATATDRKPAGAASGRFEPTEKVRADFDVSFPVDI